MVPHHSPHVRADAARDVYCESNSIPELDSFYLRNDVKALEILVLFLNIYDFSYRAIIESFECLEKNLFFSGRFFSTAMCSVCTFWSDDPDFIAR